MGQTDYREFARTLKHQTMTIVPLDQYQKDSLWVTLTSVDVSQSGILFESPCEYKVGEQYMLRVTGKNNKLYDRQIEIIRAEEIITHTQYSIGARFVTDDFNFLKNLV